MDGPHAVDFEAEERAERARLGLLYLRGVALAFGGLQHAAAMAAREELLRRSVAAVDARRRQGHRLYKASLPPPLEEQYASLLRQHSKAIASLAGDTGCQATPRRAGEASASHASTPTAEHNGAVARRLSLQSDDGSAQAHRGASRATTRATRTAATGFGPDGAHLWCQRLTVAEQLGAEEHRAREEVARQARVSRGRILAKEHVRAWETTADVADERAANAAAWRRVNPRFCEPTEARGLFRGSLGDVRPAVPLDAGILFHPRH